MGTRNRRWGGNDLNIVASIYDLRNNFRRPVIKWGEDSTIRKTALAQSLNVFFSAPEV